MKKLFDQAFSKSKSNHSFMSNTLYHELKRDANTTTSTKEQRASLCESIPGVDHYFL